MKTHGLLLALTLLWTHPACAEPVVVPLPKRVTPAPSVSRVPLGDKFAIQAAEATPRWREHLRVFAKHLRRLSRHDAVKLDPKAMIVVRSQADSDPEAYRLSSDDRGVIIDASTLPALAHATATLLQLAGEHGSQLPNVVIEDRPESIYRSLMIDLGRNAHSLALLKEAIDLCWFYKINLLHLHLTDDQRWAFPSKAFPKLLTPRGAISWDEFVDLQRYATVRGVTLMPELEVPGHSGLLCQTYPEVFGKNSTEVAKLASSRAAIKVLLDEMIELFPDSPYVHIGGDEAFGVPEELQRDLINELHAHLETRGRKTVVWEGPARGRSDNQVNKEVIHLNWRTINFPADQMLAAGYPVVNAGWDPLYVVDHYPRNNFTMVSPRRLYETLDIRRFKHFNPAIRTFAEPIVVEPTDRLIGFCMPWWEGREENFLPLVVPRLIPMAAIAWNREQETDYAAFAERVKASEATQTECFYPVKVSASPLVLEGEGVFHRRTTVSLDSFVEGTIHYTLDGSEPTGESPRYDRPFTLSQSTLIRAAVFVEGDQTGHGSRLTLVAVDPVENLALGKPVAASVSAGPLFTPARLTDGGTGNLDYFLGYPTMPEPIEITIDLGEPTEFDRVVVHAYTSGSSYESYEVQVSASGVSFTRVGQRLAKPEKIAGNVTHDFPPTTARYVRIVTHGNKGQVFDSFSRITEVQVFRAR